MHWIAPAEKDTASTTLEQRLWEGYVRSTCLCRARDKHVYVEHLIMSSKVGERMEGRDFITFSST